MSNVKTIKLTQELKNVLRTRIFENFYTLHRDFEFSKVADMFEKYNFTWANRESLIDYYALEEDEDYIIATAGDDSTSAIETIIPKERYIRCWVDGTLRRIVDKIMNQDKLELYPNQKYQYSEYSSHECTGRFDIGIDIYYIEDNPPEERLQVEFCVRFIPFEFEF